MDTAKPTILEKTSFSMINTDTDAAIKILCQDKIDSLQSVVLFGVEVR